MRKRDDIHTAEGKREFIKNFLNSVRNELQEKAAKMPAERDGHELRWLVADKFSWEQQNWKGRYANSFRKRRREYANEVLVRGL